jgi:hypothetical protein
MKNSKLFGTAQLTFFAWGGAAKRIAWGGGTTPTYFVKEATFVASPFKTCISRPAKRGGA